MVFDSLQFCRAEVSSGNMNIEGGTFLSLASADYILCPKSCALGREAECSDSKKDCLASETSYI